MKNLYLFDICGTIYRSNTTFDFLRSSGSWCATSTTTEAMCGKNSEGVRRLSGKRLFIYGAGGLGRDVLRLSRRINRESTRWSEISFVDDGCLKKEINGAPVLRFDVYLAQRREDDVFVIATGETVVRKQLWEKLAAQGIPLETLVSPEVRCV